MGKTKTQSSYEKCRQEIAKRYNDRIRELEEENKKLLLTNVELKEELKRTQDALDKIKLDLKLLGIGENTLLDKVQLMNYSSSAYREVIDKYSSILKSIT